MKKILMAIGYIILVVLLLIIILINLLSALDITVFGFRTYKIGSGSMEPALKVNNLIIIKEFKDYEIGDIVTFNYKGDKVTHRIVSINENEVITKGDANNTNDKPIKKEDIIGKVIYNFTVINYINYLLSKPLTWLLILVIGLFIITVTTYMKQHGRHERESLEGKHAK